MKKTLLLIFMTLLSINSMLAQDEQNLVFSDFIAEGWQWCGEVTDEKNKICQISFSVYQNASPDVLPAELTIPSSIDGYSVQKIKSLAGIPMMGAYVTTINIPSSVSEIEEYGFYMLSDLKSIDISNISIIGTYAFWGCSSLSSFTIPAKTQKIGFGILAYNNLNSLTVEEGNPYYISENNAIIEKETHNLIQGCKSTIIPETVLAIAPNAFTGVGLSEIAIPKSVTMIDNNAFSGNSSLEKVISYIEEPFNIPDNVFANWHDDGETFDFTTATLYVPAGTKAKYEAAEGWKNFKEIIEMDGETGIATSVKGEASIDNYYDFNGHKLNKPTKGINIIKMSDGSFKKAIVK